jgi:competence protein ComEC
MGQTQAAERIVIPQLYALGIRRIDGLVISHGDDDHASGLGALVRSHRPPWVTTSIPGETVVAKLAAAGVTEVPLARCRLGLSWVWDDVWFRFVYPFGTTPEKPDLAGENEDSCVLEVIDAQGRRLLLTGDIPQMQEEEIVDRAPWLHRYAAARAGAPMVVVAAHHGSRGSSAEKFLSALAPAAVVFQAGYRSRFNHPHPEVLQRLQALSIPNRRTDLEGDLLLTWHDQTPQFTSAAETRRRFWHPPRSDPRLLGDPAAVHIPGHAAHLVRSR